jgi:hypothetical protein
MVWAVFFRPSSSCEGAKENLFGTLILSNIIVLTCRPAASPCLAGVGQFGVEHWLTGSIGTYPINYREVHLQSGVRPAFHNRLNDGQSWHKHWLYDYGR